MGDTDDADRGQLVLLAGGHRLAALALGPRGAAGAPAGDVELVERILRLALAAGRAGLAVRLERPDPGLRAVVELFGVAGRLGCSGPGRADDPPAPPGAQASSRAGRPK